MSRLRPNGGAVILSLLMLLALALFLTLPWLFSATSQDGFYGVPIRVSAPALMKNGQDLLKAHDGPASVVFFGYRGCSDACPLQVVNIIKLQQRMSDRDLRFIFVTLAPERVSAGELDRWTDSMGDNVQGFRPQSPTEAQKLMRAFGGYSANQGHRQEQEFTHTANLHVVTPDGIRRLLYTTVALDLDKVAQDLERLLVSE